MADRRPAGLEAQICSYVTLTFRTCRTEPVLFRTVTSRQLGPTAVVGRLETVAPPCAYRARRRRPGKAEGPSRAGPGREGEARRGHVEREGVAGYRGHVGDADDSGGGGDTDRLRTVPAPERPPRRRRREPAPGSKVLEPTGPGACRGPLGKSRRERAGDVDGRNHADTRTAGGNGAAWAPDLGPDLRAGTSNRNFELALRALPTRGQWGPRTIPATGRSKLLTVVGHPRLTLGPVRPRARSSPCCYFRRPK